MWLITRKDFINFTHVEYKKIKQKNMRNSKQRMWENRTQHIVSVVVSQSARHQLKDSFGFVMIVGLYSIE
jgi:hypothetical protein